jgi:hypothetical protein
MAMKGITGETWSYKYGQLQNKTNYGF